MSDLNLLKNRLSSINEHIISKKGELEILTQNINKKENQKNQKIKKNENLLLKKKLIEESCKEARENGRMILSQIASSSVQSIFDENTEVDFKLSTKDGVPISDVVICNDYNGIKKEINPAEADGGGLADALSVALRMSFGQTVDDNYFPYILDEPSKFVSKGELSEKFSNFLVSLVNYTKRQTIVSTHDEEYLLNQGNTKHVIVKDWTTGISNVTREK